MIGKPIRRPWPLLAMSGRLSFPFPAVRRMVEGVFRAGWEKNKGGRRGAASGPLRRGVVLPMTAKQLPGVVLDDFGDGHASLDFLGQGLVQYGDFALFRFLLEIRRREGVNALGDAGQHR